MKRIYAVRKDGKWFTGLWEVPQKQWGNWEDALVHANRKSAEEDVTDFGGTVVAFECNEVGHGST